MRQTNVVVVVVVVGIVFAVDDTTTGEVDDRIDVVVVVVDGTVVGIVVVVVVVVVDIVVVNLVDIGLEVVERAEPKSVILTKAHRFSSDPPTLYQPLKMRSELLYLCTLNIQLFGRLNNGPASEKTSFHRYPDLVGVEGR